MKYLTFPLLLVIFIVFFGCQDAKEMVDTVIPPENEPEYTYLGLKPNEYRTLTPSNPYHEWLPVTVNEAYVKIRDGRYYTLMLQGARRSPEGLTTPQWVEGVSGNPLQYDQDFEHWIRLHAESKVVYNLTPVNLSDGDYSHFSGSVALANPWSPTSPGCGHSGSVAFFFEVDDTLVFSSQIVVGIEQTAPIRVEFEIPTDAETLTISVSDAGDGIGCDHWTLGDARLRHMPQ